MEVGRYFRFIYSSYFTFFLLFTFWEKAGEWGGRGGEGKGRGISFGRLGYRDGVFLFFFFFFSFPLMYFSLEVIGYHSSEWFGMHGQIFATEPRGATILEL